MDFSCCQERKKFLDIGRTCSIVTSRGQKLRISFRNAWPISIRAAEVLGLVPQKVYNSRFQRQRSSHEGGPMADIDFRHCTLIYYNVVTCFVAWVQDDCCFSYLFFSVSFLQNLLRRGLQSQSLCFYDFLALFSVILLHHTNVVVVSERYKIHFVLCILCNTI